MTVRASRLVVCVAIAIALTGCWGGYLAEYQFDGRASRNDGTARPQPMDATLIEEQVRFSDENSTWTWRINDYGIHLDIRSAGNDTLSVRWDQATYVDEHGSHHALVVSGERVTDLNKPSKVSTSIGAGQHDTLLLFPASYLRSGSVFGLERTLFDPPGFRVGRTPEEIERLAGWTVGQSIGFSIPVSIGSDAGAYDFTFVVTDVGARRSPIS